MKEKKKKVKKVIKYHLHVPVLRISPAPLNLIALIKNVQF